MLAPGTWTGKANAASNGSGRRSFADPEKSKQSQGQSFARFTLQAMARR
jgi:hypothetical protein